MFGFYKRLYEQMCRDYARLQAELQSFKEAVFEKEVIKDLKNQLAIAEKNADVLQGQLEAFRSCNNTLTEALNNITKK